jgi:hypothetical protein
MLSGRSDWPYFERIFGSHHHQIEAAMTRSAISGKLLAMTSISPNSSKQGSFSHTEQ